jgi:hypothetical protein
VIEDTSGSKPGRQLDHRATRPSSPIGSPLPGRSRRWGEDQTYGAGRVFLNL